MERRRIKFPLMVADKKNINNHIYTKQVCTEIMDSINKHSYFIKKEDDENQLPLGIINKSYFEGNILYVEGINLINNELYNYNHISSQGWGNLHSNGEIYDYELKYFVASIDVVPGRNFLILKYNQLITEKI